MLSDKGLKTWASIEPYPTPNIVKQDLLKILNKISFADKIVFGKLNYNVKISQFKEAKQFYEDSANLVKDFCIAKGIELHIKYGTQAKDNKVTEILFRKNHPLKTAQAAACSF